MAENLMSYFHNSSSSDCCGSESNLRNELDARPEDYVGLQNRIDKLLSGDVELPKDRTPSEADRRPFAPFILSDKERAQALAALCELTANEDKNSFKALDRAVDELYNHLGILPTGMVEHATKLFLTHSKVAKRFLKVSPLITRQPNLFRDCSP